MRETVEMTISPTQAALRRLLGSLSVCCCLGVVGLVALVGIYAPFLCNEVAVVWSDSGGLRLPILRSLFNANEYPQLYDLGFNVLALLLPVLLVGWFALRRRWSAGRRLSWSLIIWMVAVAASLVPIWKGEALYDQRPWTPETVAKRASADWALFPLIVTRANQSYPGAKLLPPGSAISTSGGIHLLGTDDDTEDVFANFLYGARVSLTIGVLATVLSMGIGLIIGALSGYFGGWIDIILQRMVEIMMCFPTFILVLVVVSMFGAKLIYIVVVIGLTGWAGTARLVRGEYLAQTGRDYVLAAQSLGLPQWRIMFVHILPNVLTPLIIGATFGVAGTVFMESGLAFLGFDDPDAPSWGGIMEQGRNHPAYLWLIFTPGVAIFALVYSLNVIGTALRDALDPKGTR